jgi:hypothetical protein
VRIRHGDWFLAGLPAPASVRRPVTAVGVRPDSWSATGHARPKGPMERGAAEPFPMPGLAEALEATAVDDVHGFNDQVLGYFATTMCVWTWAYCAIISTLC